MTVYYYLLVCVGLFSWGPEFLGLLLNPSGLHTHVCARYLKFHLLSLLEFSISQQPWYSIPVNPRPQNTVNCIFEMLHGNERY